MDGRAKKPERALTAELVAQVRKELEALLSEPPLSNSDRLKRFLRHVVEETIEGRSDRLSGYTIALDVFNKDQDFDPNRNCAELAGAGWWFNSCGTVPECNPMGLSSPSLATTHAHIALPGLAMSTSTWGVMFDKIRLTAFIKRDP